MGSRLGAKKTIALAAMGMVLGLIATANPAVANHVLGSGSGNMITTQSSDEDRIVNETDNRNNVTGAPVPDGFPVTKPTDEPTFVSGGELLVDTGAEITWVRSSLLEELGIPVKKKGLTIDEVVFGQDGDLQLLGARTLEGFNAMVDSTHRRLVAAGPIPAATGLSEHLESGANLNV
ncbi:MAG: hypothetical protein ACR2M4_09100 [Actinomycetota bacterium]